MGIKVYLYSKNSHKNNKTRSKLEKLGCFYVDTNDNFSNLKDFNVISFCNKYFLQNIETIKKYARNAIFVNCMTWNFDEELIAQENDHIDLHLYQTNHQFLSVSKKLKNLGTKYNYKLFHTYFDSSSFPFIDRNNTNKFNFGRISRSDLSKYSNDQLWIWDRIVSPKQKRGIILGWNEILQAKFGEDIPYYVTTHAANSISRQDFYKECDFIIMSTNTYENLPRVGLEAMSSGSLLIVDRRDGWKVLVDDGHSGWLCGDRNEFVYKASRAAFEKDESNNMRMNARNIIDKKYTKEISSQSWEKIFNSLQ